MNDKLNHIESSRHVGSNYFRLQSLKKSNKTLESYLDKFNPADYFILKATRNQRLVSNKEFLEFEFARYVFFKKEKYDINHINLWFEWLKNMGGIQFLDKPLPPFNPNKNIILR